MIDNLKDRIQKSIVLTFKEFTGEGYYQRRKSKYNSFFLGNARISKRRNTQRYPR